MNECTFSFYLDTRRLKDNKKYPVRLQAFSSVLKMRKYYTTSIDLTIDEFEKYWLEVTPEKKFHRNSKAGKVFYKLKIIIEKANSIADELSPFSFDQFEQKMYNKSGSETNVWFCYKKKIKELEKSGKIGNADVYSLALRSFISNYKGKDKADREKSFKRLHFIDINKKWLDNYESSMIDKGRSLTTISMYLRTLRALFNSAISSGIISDKIYPFGSRNNKYEIPSASNSKRALSKQDLKKLFEAIPANEHQEIAKDFFFFSYACNGINIADIANLKHSDIKDDSFEFLRAKTATTTKKKSVKVKVFLNDYAKSTIAKYSTRSAKADDYIFDIIEKKQTAREKKREIKKFVRFINQHIKKLAEANDITSDISTYWARHSYSTQFVLNGGNMEMLQEALGHHNIKTTQNYFAGFDNETKKEMSNKIMDF